MTANNSSHVYACQGSIDVISGRSIDAIAGYRPKSLNCKSPSLERKVVVTDSKLGRLMCEFCRNDNADKSFDSRFLKAVETINNNYPVSIPSVEEIDSALVANQSAIDDDIGLFLSALYQRFNGRVVSYNLSLEVLPRHLAFEVDNEIYPNPLATSLDKIFVNRGSIWSISFTCDSPVNYGFSERGCPAVFSVNLGIITDNNSHEPPSVLLNFGRILAPVYHPFSLENIYDIGPAGEEGLHDGIYILDSFHSGGVIDVRNGVTDRSDHKLISAIRISIQEMRKSPCLMEYFNNLRARFEAGRNDNKKVEEAIDFLGPNPGEKLYNDVISILRGEGYGF